MSYCLFLVFFVLFVNAGDPPMLKDLALAWPSDFIARGST